MKTKVHFNKDYEQLLAQVVDKIHKNSIHKFAKNLPNSDQSLTFYSPFQHKPTNLYQTQQISPKIHQTPHQSSNSFEPELLKQTTYYTFGQTGISKSVEMQKTFVNFGNTRYLIHKDLPINFNQTKSFTLQSMDHPSNNSFNINDLTFPLLPSSKKPRKSPSPIPNFNEFHQIKTNLSKTYQFALKRKANPNKSYSLEINNRRRNKSIKEIENTNLLEKNPELNSENQKKSTLAISEIQRRLKAQTNDYLKQVVFSNDYEQKLLEMERNIVHKRRIEKLKLEKLKKQTNEKDKIEAWKHQVTHPNPTDELYDVFDHLKSKPLF